ncbi:2-dehydro-3-deoxygalactonokinase [Roseicyclus sp. F158]|uniref:2-dehydro-3-deoxygalactonokinase n=1 Tax=Tropicimonas omnivorans TaxID=3075590 RepID=A0ABU3DL04_9RHOB|nr:2-dehydro-3-deoxygalactonokinase [Roseicyclus sp. F158]MDT0684395.1 2-dehydro-3-deoxygalactonokinase [Roseicyclus sp. F158]
MDFIAVDWGSTRFRAWSMGADGDVLDSVESDTGLKAVEGGRFEAALMTACGDWLARDPGLPVLMSGMVGSRAGWKEAPYCLCPADLAAVTADALRFEVAGHPAAILPGATCDDALGHADVMRGEEVQIFGAAGLLGVEDAVICIPGTHSKWARLEGGRLAGFETHMTGEIFALLRNQSLVGALAEGDADDPAAFRDGLTHGMAAPLAHAAFAARADALRGTLPATSISAFLSGVLIGAELARRPEADEVVLMATGILAERYGAALDHVGAQVRFVDAKDATRAGQVRAAATLWPERVPA